MYVSHTTRLIFCPWCLCEGFCLFKYFNPLPFTFSTHFKLVDVGRSTVDWCKKWRLLSVAKLPHVWMQLHMSSTVSCQMSRLLRVNLTATLWGKVAL